MSTWRSFLKAVLPFLFKEAQVAADAAIEKKDVKGAVLGSVTDSDAAAVADATRVVLEKTAESLTKSKK